jgi:hypothetical protein
MVIKASSTLWSKSTRPRCASTFCNQDSAHSTSTVNSHMALLNWDSLMILSPVTLEKPHLEPFTQITRRSHARSSIMVMSVSLVMDAHSTTMMMRREDSPTHFPTYQKA